MHGRCVSCAPRCSADDDGGGLSIDAAEVVIERVQIIGCTARQGGGALRLTQSGELPPVLRVYDTRLERCESLDGDGGGFHLTAGVATISNTTFDGCRAERSGGALSSAATVIMRKSHITRCRSGTVSCAASHPLSRSPACWLAVRRVVALSIPRSTLPNPLRC
eukprot:5353026-Pleurochrysis_carterae.AAC.1